MTREELKKHCLKQVEACEMWAKHNGEEPHGKIYEEHKLILELLEQEPCEDCISKKAVLDKINEICFSREQEAVDFRVSQGSNGQRDLIINFIENLPSVQSKSKTEVLDKIKAEINRQEKWLMDAGYNAYNLDIAFNSIRSVVKESEE